MVQAVRRIHITGNAGSGKTTLARRLGAALELPVFGLDAIVWQPGWIKTPPKERALLEERLVSNPRWIIEGVSRIAREKADLVVLLEVSRIQAYVRCAKRNWRFLFRSRPGLPERCPEALIVPALCRIIWRFPAHVEPQILDDMKNTPSKFRRVRHRNDLDALFEEFGATA